MTGEYSESVMTGLWIPTFKTIQAYNIDMHHFYAEYDANIPTSVQRYLVGAHYTNKGL